MASPKVQKSRDEYSVGWVAALPIERAAATIMLDEVHAEPLDFDQASTDPNSYTWGCMSNHNVVIASLSAGTYGKVSSSTTAVHMLSSFPQIKFGLLVGVGAGVPSKSRDIRLGDIVVSQPDGKTGGVIQYDLKKMKAGKISQVERKGFLRPPPELLLKALAKLQAQYEFESSGVMDLLQDAAKRHPQLRPGYSYQGSENDCLFETSYAHIVHDTQNCDLCDRVNIVSRRNRESKSPQIHFGAIASGDTLLKDAEFRDSLVKELKGDADCICFEMEAAGLMDNFPCLVIRGICDYADSHKNDRWQRYASGTAAAFAKELLNYVAKGELSRTRTAANILNEIHSSVNQINASMDQAQQSEREQKVNRFLQALYTYPYAERKDRNNKRIEGMCNWFTKHDLFGSWLRSESSHLWVSADPESGKSVLARYLVDEVLPSPNNVVCYSFFKDDFPDQRSSAGALCVLLRQLLVQDLELISDSTLEKFGADGNKLIQSFWSVWAIFIFVVATATSSGRKITCVLDALDECQDSDRHLVVEAITGLSSTTMNSSSLKFIVTSRPYGDLEQAFRETTNRLLVIRLKGEGETEAKEISKEIDLVIRHRVQKIADDRSLMPEERILLLEALTSMPHRTYLWVYLTLDFIEKTPGLTTGNIPRVVKIIPKSVHDAYERVLGRSLDESRARRLLNLVIAATRPLSLHEMSVALAIEKMHSSYDDLRRYVEPVERFQNTLRNLCGLFVIIVDSKVYLLHQTAREFLIEDLNKDPSNSHSNSPKWKHSISLVESNRLLAERCIWYLNLANFEDDQNPFFIYSVRYWAFHFRKSNMHEQADLVQLALKLCSTDLVIYSMLSSKDDFTFFFQVALPEPPSPLLIASYLGVAAVVQRLLEKEKQIGKRRWFGLSRSLQRTKRSDIDVVDKYGRTLLSYAAEKGYETVVRILLEEGAGVNIPNKWGDTPLLRASSGGHEEIVRLLLKNEAKLECTNSRGDTPLYLASVNGYEGIVRLLVEKGNPSLKGGYGGNPLRAAVDNGHEAVVRLLLQNRADVNFLDSDGKEAPLHQAARNGHIGMVKLLVDNGANVSIQDRYGFAPLHQATLHSHAGVIKLLLESGAVVNVQDDNGWTPLHQAVRNGHMRVVELLLEKGADANIQTEEIEETPLHRAAYYASIEVMKVLLEHGADVNLRDRYGESPLHKAVYRDSIEAVNQLLEHGADMDITDAAYGETALFKAVFYKHETVARLLLENGARTDIQDIYGRAMLEKAQSSEMRNYC